MCKNAQQTAYDVLVAVEPELKSILTIAGVVNTPQAVTALAAYDQAVTDLKNWVPGTPSQDVIEVLTDVQLAVSALTPMIPATDALLINAVLAAVVTVIGLVTGNSPAPAPAALVDGVTPEDMQSDHERTTMAVYTQRAQSLVPFYKIKTRATWLPERRPDAQAKACWNKACDLTGHAGWKQ